MESTTLGDISELAALKDRMEAAEKVQSKKTKKAAPIEEKIVVEDEEPVEDQVVIEEPVVETTAPETEEPVVETPATETEETEAPAAPKTRKKKEPTQENDDSAEKEA
jgi:outer membrane biosynthesis protein TonB